MRKLVLQLLMCSHLVGLDVWFLVGPFVYFHISCVRTTKALARLRRLAWAFTGCLCGKYHNLMSDKQTDVPIWQRKSWNLIISCHVEAGSWNLIISCHVEAGATKILSLCHQPQALQLTDVNQREFWTFTYVLSFFFLIFDFPRCLIFLALISHLSATFYLTV